VLPLAGAFPAIDEQPLFISANPPKNMPDPASPAPPAGATTTSTGRRAAQSKRIANFVVEAQTFLQTASTDAEIRPILEAHGYGDADFAEGTALAAAAGSGLDLRQEKLGGRNTARDELNLSAREARGAYSAFRTVARAAFPKQQDRVGLGLSGDVPEDFERFITLARTSYKNAGKAPYATKITKRGYPAARLSTLLANLDSFTEDKADKEEAEGEAIGATEARDKAYADLRAYMQELKGVARGALRGKRALLAKLEL
jgi:hypothetical protein